MKTRHIGIGDFLFFLQVEYFINKFRKSIYPSKKDKEYHAKVMKFKEEKIISLSNKNRIPCIFNDDSAYSELQNQVYPRGVHSENFDLTEKDLKFLYSVGSEVTFKYEDNQLIGCILITEKDVCYVKIKGKTEPLAVLIKNLRPIMT